MISYARQYTEDLVQTISRNITKQTVESEIRNIFGSNFLQNKMRNLFSEMQMLGNIVKGGEEAEEL